MANYHIAQLDEIAAVACPCGSARRAFAEVAGGPASVHVVEISADARTHYHKRQTEIYVILEGSGHLELDGERVPVRPLTAVVIRPPCRHRAVGRMKILNMVIPPFDAADEYET
ncbi:MAG: cupin domain-containing protein [Planctomycetota bacterium]|nr:cupin domain-containing protein [Planctomycetota bacterium]